MMNVLKMNFIQLVLIEEASKISSYVSMERRKNALHELII